MSNLIDIYKYKLHSNSSNFNNLSNIHKNNNLSSNRKNVNSDKYNQKSDKNDLLKVGAPTLGVILTALLFTKGFQKNISGLFQKLKDYIDYNIEINSATKKNTFSKVIGRLMMSFSLLLNKSESINNITSLKDILFMKFMYLTKPTQYIHQAITRLFDNISHITVKKYYYNTGKRFQRMYREFEKLDNYILSTSKDEKILYKGKEYSTEELINLARSYREEISLAINTFISNSSINWRREYIKGLNSKLYQTFWDASFKDLRKFKKKEMWQTFIAAEQMKADKTFLAQNVSVLRNMITYNGEDKSIAISKLLTDLRKVIPNFDEKSYNQIRKLEWFTKSPDGLKNNPEVFLKELTKLKKQPELQNISPKIVENLQNTKLSYINLITDLVNETGTGEIQDLISVYYKLAPFEFAKSGTLKSVKKAVESFDKAVYMETSEYFDKVRDLELGSAPTDILTILFSTYLILKDLSKAKDDNKKKTVLLTSGIPLAGAIATTMLATSQLVSGGKSLLLGAASGIALNITGKVVDKYRLKKLSKDNKNGA